MKTIFSLLIFSIYINTSLSQNVHLFCSNGESVDEEDLKSIVRSLVDKTGRTNLYFSIDGLKKDKIKFSKRNINNVSLVASNLKGSYISGSDIEREAQASKEGFDYLCFIQYPPRYLGNIRRYTNKINGISEIVSKIRTSNKRDLKKLDIFLFYNSSPPTLSVNNITSNTKFIYNRFISGTIKGNLDLEKFRVYIKINNESPVAALVNSDGTWSAQIKSLRSNTKIDLEVYGYPQNHKTDTTEIEEYTNITYSENPQIEITDPINDVVPRCKLNGSSTYRIAFKGYDIDDTKLQLKLDFNPFALYNRDKCEEFHIIKGLTWIVPWNNNLILQAKEELGDGQNLYCFFLDFGADVQTKILECRDPSIPKVDDIHDCSLDLEIMGTFQYEIEDGKFMNLGAPKAFSFDTFSQDVSLMPLCKCGSR